MVHTHVACSTATESCNHEFNLTAIDFVNTYTGFNANEPATKTQNKKKKP